MKLILSLALCLGIVLAGASSIEINSGEIATTNSAYFVFAAGGAIHNNTGTPFYSVNTLSVPETTATVFYGPEGILDAVTLNPALSMGLTTVKNYSSVLYPGSTTAVPRWWSISTTSDQLFNLTVRLRNGELSGFTATDLRVWEHDATGWHMISLAPDNITIGSSFTALDFNGLQFFAPAKGAHDIILGTEDSQTLPVTLSSFTATISVNNSIMIQWVTQSETNLAGYRIYRASTENLESAEDLNRFIEGSNTSQGQTYVFYDKEITQDGEYYYWLESQDIDGSAGLFGPTSVNVTFNSGNQTPTLPLINSIDRIYPNPFNPNVSIRYAVKAQNDVRIKIYNVKGQLVRAVLSGSKTAGFHEVDWNGTDEKGYPCSSGVYMVVLTIGKESFKQQIVLMK
ncbi:MAG: hypothetical protein CVU48_07430 [Candidatus Cloacimonetes bacterium HGW-Cloacimonetes-1]|jgi:hypothetical protein|nr:MAG: hypothetical protein CVU48_07430 [Candidatus Cloacimonetes bacterium HGW-Cloacimonetes-1]